MKNFVPIFLCRSFVQVFKQSPSSDIQRRRDVGNPSASTEAGRMGQLIYLFILVITLALTLKSSSEAGCNNTLTFKDLRLGRNRKSYCRDGRAPSDLKHCTYCLQFLEINQKVLVLVNLS